MYQTLNNKGIDMGSDILEGAFLYCITTGERVQTKSEYSELIGKAKRMGIDTDFVRKKYGLGAFEQLKKQTIWN